MAKPSLTLSGMKVEEVYDSLIQGGVAIPEAATIISDWIFENLGRTRRTFNYRTEFPEVEPACAATFVRTFQHDDWVDGESVVQAEQTGGEDGFNARFHRIEADLDALGADVAQSFTCLAELRSDLRKLLDEIRAEVNLLNADVYECCRGKPLPGGGRFGGFEVIRDFEFVATAKFLDKDVHVFQTQAGLAMLPAIEQIAVDPVFDPRIRHAGDLGRFVVEDPRVTKRFPGNLTKRAFVEAFGTDLTKSGEPVSEVLAILPDDAKFGSVDSLVETVAERQASALRTTSLGTAAIEAAFGLEPGGSVADASVERFSAIPRRGRVALATAGIDTVGKLAGVAPKRVVAILKKEGLVASAADAAEWSAQARALTLSLKQ
jgi:hypothetical protein